MAEPSHYDVLGVPPTASAEDIRAAYRSAARALHPDAGGSAAGMRRLNDAWHVLRDPGRRALYDRNLAGQAGAAAGSAGRAGPGDRPAGTGRDGGAGDQARRPGDPPDRSEEWAGVAEDLLDDTPYGPTAAPDGWWAILPPATAMLALVLLLGAFVFRSPALIVFSVAAFFVACGLFVLAPLRAMTRAHRPGASGADPAGPDDRT
jgi:DnaJ domain